MSGCAFVRRADRNPPPGGTPLASRAATITLSLTIRKEDYKMQLGSVVMAVGEVYERSVTVSLCGILTFDSLRSVTLELEQMLAERRGWCVILDLSATVIHTVVTQWVAMAGLLREVTDRWVIVGNHPDVVHLADGLISLCWSGVWVDQASSAHVARLLATTV